MCLNMKSRRLDRSVVGTLNLVVSLETVNLIDVRVW
jgi:hypothetical protein